MTTKYEIIGYYWQDEDGNLVLMYREFRLWAFDFDINSLSGSKGDNPAWGDYGYKLVKSGVGKGFEAGDRAFILNHLNLDINYKKLLDLPISNLIYSVLLPKLDEYGFSSSFAPSIHIIIDYFYWMQSYAQWEIWGKEGYRIYAYGRYVSVHGTCFMAVDIESSPLPPSGGGIEM